MKAIVLLGQLLFGKLPFCSVVGGMIGVVAGTFMGLAEAALGGAMPPMASIVSHSLLLALVGWVTVLVMFGLWLHYGIVQIALPAAVNAVLTSFLTMWLNLLIQLPWLATLIGLLVGILVGLILCQFCRPISKATGRLPNG
ncbi:MAG: hypothetical protein QOE49_5036 [Rhodospirillaceae bacterium]|jgi:hypothetical protein|nr:hypothetical protein [Rhodospirillaceae bacterium]